MTVKELTSLTNFTSLFFLTCIVSVNSKWQAMA